jgi:uncharacterized membrane protein (DUF106 family)
MDFKSTFIINLTAWGIGMADIHEAVKIAALIVGTIYTIVQILKGLAELEDRKYRINKAKEERKRRKKERDDKKLQEK